MNELEYRKLWIFFIDDLIISFIENIVENLIYDEADIINKLEAPGKYI